MMTTTTTAAGRKPTSINSILAQSLPKPGLTDTLRYWQLSRPITEIPAPSNDTELSESY